MRTEHERDRTLTTAHSATTADQGIGRKLHWHVFQPITDTKGEACEGPFSTFREHVLDAVKRKTCRPGVNKKGDTLHKDRLPGFGPYRLEGTRLADNVRSISLLALDFDQELDMFGLVSAVEALAAPAIVYGSPSDRPAKRKARVFVETDRDMTKAEAKLARAALANLLGFALDASTINADRVYYAGRAEGDPPREVHTFNGEPFSVEVLLAHAKSLPAHVRSTRSRA